MPHNLHKIYGVEMNGVYISGIELPWFEFAGLDKVWGLIGGVANCGDESRFGVIFEVDSKPGVIFWVDSNFVVIFGVDSNLDVALGVTVCGIFRAEAGTEIETAIMLSKANIILYIDIPPKVTPLTQDDNLFSERGSTYIICSGPALPRYYLYS